MHHRRPIEPSGPLGLSPRDQKHALSNALRFKNLFQFRLMITFLTSTMGAVGFRPLHQRANNRLVGFAAAIEIAPRLEIHFVAKHRWV